MFHISGPIVLTPNTYALAECQKIQAKYALTFEVFYIIWVLKLFHCYIRFHFISVFFSKLSSGWGGLNTDPIFETRPSGFAHARNDIASTFMIFYR